MDIYLTGHLALAFGIFAKIYQSIRSFKSIKQINLYIFIIRPFFCPRSETKKPPKKISEIFLPYLFCPRLPLTIIPNTPIRDK